MNILVVDDDPRLRELLTLTLNRAGFQVVTASNGQQALISATRDNPDLIVLDVGLPELDGLEVCRRLRQTSDVPILFLTARDDEIDRILGLELGADDYVTKPFSPRELVARIKTILKRSQRATAPTIHHHGDLTLDPDRHHCAVNGTPVALTRTESQILLTLLQRPDHVITRSQLTDAIYGIGSPVSDRTLDSHLRNLRRKLSEAGWSESVETIHGVGLRLKPWLT
ncbi:response regulator transcription factor [Tropicibacter sp. Alg240-R139]|uniref:response regulator transcription factor n=1 Tax=Tropicibacter sp. Alg240-R139 TaxID=2305991 RepID=UPI0013DF7334|nr:response regulator transcription factor [Tropicibacter sp. Alg240-R139]